MACLWACERLHFFVYGRRFRLATDHQALRTLLTAGGTGHRPLRLHRWTDRLFQYDFEVCYKPDTGSGSMRPCLTTSMFNYFRFATTHQDIRFVCCSRPEVVKHGRFDPETYTD